MSEQTPSVPEGAVEAAGLPRYGLRWNGPAEPVATPMDDGYWTPYHLAVAATKQAQKERDFLVAEYERAVGCGNQGYLHASLHLFNAIANARADLAAEQAQAAVGVPPEPYAYWSPIDPYCSGYADARNSTNFRMLLEQHRAGKPRWPEGVTLLYTAPPEAVGAQVGVPDAMGACEHVPDEAVKWAHGDVERAYRMGWNDYRDAMLAAPKTAAEGGK